jgi:sulfate permease, SulP family
VSVAFNAPLCAGILHRGRIAPYWLDAEIILPAHIPSGSFAPSAVIRSLAEHPCRPMRQWLSHIRGDVCGGIASAAVAVPLAMGYGMFAFVSLGESYFASGALAGLYTAFIVALVCVLIGEKSTTIYAPRINTTFFLGLLVYGLVHSELPVIRAGGIPLIIAITFAVILLGGAFEAAFGLARLGTLIRFAPHSVMAGFQNAAALLLFLVQLGSVCGFDRNMPFTEVPAHADAIRPLSVVIAAITFAIMWNTRRILPRIPPVVVGMAVGCALYYGLLGLGFGDHLGPVIAGEPRATMNVAPFVHIYAAWSPDILTLVPSIVAGALALATIAALDALLCAKLVTPPGERRIDGDRLLLRLGIGNMVAACIGGITSGLNIGPSVANRAFGARTPLAVVVNAAVLVAACTLLFPLLGQIPRVALSAVIMVVAVQHFDLWNLTLVRNAMKGGVEFRRTALLELLVVVGVATLSVALDIVAAVAIGVAIAVVLFVLSMSRSVVRRSYRCAAVRSRRSRTAQEREVLAQCGSGILVMELQGPLFFGTGENLTDQIDAELATSTRWIILDLRRISEIDSTGARTFLEIQANTAHKQVRLVLAIPTRSRATTRLNDFGVAKAIGADRIFPDADRAIEQAEDELLRDAPSAQGDAEEIPLMRAGLLADLDGDEIAIAVRHLTRVCHPHGAIVFREGDPGAELLVIVKGRASAFLTLPDGTQVRLATFGPGTIFGELALLDEGLRSATVMADGSLDCYALSRTGFAALVAEAPVVAIKVLRGLGRELSGRLRSANRTIHELET